MKIALDWRHAIPQNHYRRIAVAIIAVVLLAPSAAGAEPTLHGIVVDHDTRKPIPFVNVTLDSAVTHLSTRDGAFAFGGITTGRHVLTFEHIAYVSHSMVVQWPADSTSLVVALRSSQFTVGEIVVEAERPPPSFPLGVVTISRQATTTIPGNIANDPLRTIQQRPSASAAGIEFLSSMTVRGGDTEEHRVYLDDYPLYHSAHVGGFTSVVYDDMLRSTTLISGAAPIQYKGLLSGVVLLETETPDTNARSVRYDITSMAGGFTQVITPSVVVQGSAKGDFFNLPVQQRVNVETRSFTDVLGRAVITPAPPLRITATVVGARDTEAGQGGERKTRSVLAGAEMTYGPSGWGIDVRSWYSYYSSHDRITWPQDEREHRLDDARFSARVHRRDKGYDIGLSGEAGTLRHLGSSGEVSDTPVSAWASAKLMYKDLLAGVVALGGNREPWTSDFEPEGYGSLRLNLGERAKLSAGYRRSHQTPFVFYEPRFFASIPIDPGDLLNSYSPLPDDAKAVRMDQSSVEATVALMSKWSLGVNGFRRSYERLLTWEWSASPDPMNVTNDGKGHGAGYEFILARNDPDFVSVMASVASARVWKREGTLDNERVGDFDRPSSWQLGVTARLSERLRLAFMWRAVGGRPYTSYQLQNTAPGVGEINTVRLPNYRRLDLKLVYSLHKETFQGEIFVDVINALNRRNIATMWAFESTPGTFTSLPFGGVDFFPIGGVTIRF